MIDMEGLDLLIEDAKQVQLPRPRTRPIVLTVPEPRHDIEIPDAGITLLEDYELYVG